MNNSSSMIKRGRLLGVLCAVVAFGLIGTSYAALQDSGKSKRGQVLVGLDNDNTDNSVIQPIPTPPGADQSLKKSDQITGGRGDDLLIGRLGPDVLDSGAGDDVIVGGTEGGQPGTPPPNNDIAFGREGSDTFVWTPGDGSDAFIGGDAAKTKKSKKGKKASIAQKGKKKKSKKKTSPEVDTLVIGNPLVTADISIPVVFKTKFGFLPKIFSSDRGVPTPLGGVPPRNPNLTGFCEIVPAPAGLGYEFLVRFFAAPGNLAVTIRTKGVEQVICPTNGTDAATQTTLGKKGAGPSIVKTADFRAAPKSKLAAFVF
jgi:hypothetical protein